MNGDGTHHDHVRFELHYHPLTDSLVGRAEPSPRSNDVDEARSADLMQETDTRHEFQLLAVIPPAPDLIEQPDADLSLEWHRSPRGEQLSGFRLLHASHRLAHSTVDDLPPTVLRAATHVINETTPSMMTANADSITRRTTISVEVSLADLERRRPPLDESHLDAAGARRVAAALDRLAATIDRLGSPSTELESNRTAHLVLALQELASAFVDGGGRTAPGASAAAHDAVRGGVPLSRREQSQLRDILAMLDQPSRWGTATEHLDDITTSISHNSH